MREPVKTGWLPFVRCMGAARQVATLCAKGFAFLCPEDNMSQDLAEKIAPHHKSGEVFPLIATQGTGILSAPVSRLRGIGHSTFARSSLFSREVLRSTALVLCGVRGSRWIISRLLRLPVLPGDHDHPRLRIVLFE